MIRFLNENYVQINKILKKLLKLHIEFELAKIF